MRFGTKTKTTPSGLPAAGWWRRGVAALIDQTLTLGLMWFTALTSFVIIGKALVTAFTQTAIDVRIKLGDVTAGLAGQDRESLQQQYARLMEAYNQGAWDHEQFYGQIVNTYFDNLQLSTAQFLLVLVLIAGTIAFVIYNQIIRIHRKGRTFGDGLVGIYTVTSTAQFPNYTKAAVRYLAVGAIVGVLSTIGDVISSIASITSAMIGLVLLAEVFLPLFDPHARSLHDRLAGTYPTHPDRFGYALEHLTAPAREAQTSA